MKLELSLHSVICGRTRKNIRLIESASNTAIYFPPPFPRIYGYTPPGAHRRGEDEVYITGDNQESINVAKKKLHELVMNTKCYVKDVMVSANKVDSILLDRLDKVRKVMETNGSYVLFPTLGSQRGLIRVQGTEILHVERTVREIMALVFITYDWQHDIFTEQRTGWTILRRIVVAYAARKRPSKCHESSCPLRHSHNAFGHLHELWSGCWL